MRLAIRSGFALVLVAFCLVLVAAQNQEPAGKPIGSISTDGDLIRLTLDEGVLGHANLFDLAKHTLRFTPDSGGYRVENAAFTWDPAFGDELPVRTRTSGAARVRVSFSAELEHADGRCDRIDWFWRRASRSAVSINCRTGPDPREQDTRDLRVHEAPYVRVALRQKRCQIASSSPGR